MAPTPAPEASPNRPTRMLTNSNKDLARDGIFTFTLPALVGMVGDRKVLTCPQAGKCALICYARHGSYTWPKVRAAHERNLAFIVEDIEGWEAAMTAELTHKRYVGKNVRIHDSGDFFSDAYLLAWLRIIRATPRTYFYAYTKEVARFRELVEPDCPENFGFVYSKGGRQDVLLTPRDRTADVFPTEEAIAEAGAHSQAASDLLAVKGPAPVGMRANSIRAFQRKQGNRTLGEWQAEDLRGPKTDR